MIEMMLKIAGEPIVLNRDRAIWWPSERHLLLADVHFGKGSVLRQAGIAVPTGQTQTDLARLDQLIERYHPRQLIVLGDLVHGRSSIDAPWVKQVNDWRQQHAAVAMQLIAGNHDRHFDARLLGFEVISDDLLIAPFVLRHAPGVSSRGYVLAGHLHPGITVRDGWRRHRLPAFRFNSHTGILPAFGSLTGLHEHALTASDRIVAVTPAGLLDVSRRLTAEEQ